MIEVMNGLCLLDKKTVKKTKGGIVLPESGRQTSAWATGVVVDFDREFLGEFHKTSKLQVGDTVVFYVQEGTPVEIDGRKLIVVGLDRLIGITKRVATGFKNVPDVIPTDNPRDNYPSGEDCLTS